MWIQFTKDTYFLITVKLRLDATQLLKAVFLLDQNKTDDQKSINGTGVSPTTSN